MKRSILTPLILSLCLVIFVQTRPVFAQTGAGYRPNYRFLHSGNVSADKDFYLLTVISHSPRLEKLLASDDTLNVILHD